MSYHSDVSPSQAYAVISDTASAAIVDVRTKEEWAFVGVPVMDEAAGQYIQVEWNQAGGVRNESFVDELAVHGLNSEAPVMFLCRSGARSQAAAIAASQAGFVQAQNIVGGFEGDLDHAGHRGTVCGWKADGLPWKQS